MAKQETRKSQAEKFIDKVRELGCDESEEAFDETLKRLGKAPPQPKEKPKKDKPGQ